MLPMTLVLDPVRLGAIDLLGTTSDSRTGDKTVGMSIPPPVSPMGKKLKEVGLELAGKRPIVRFFFFLAGSSLSSSDMTVVPRG